MKKLFKMFIVLVMVIASLPLTFNKELIASSSNEKLKILQIVNSSSATIASNSKYDVTTMEMKQFVAERKDLDGLYDVIYIADGAYSPALPVVQPTTSNYNDTPSTVYEWKKNKYQSATNKKVGQRFTNQITNNTNSVMNDITELKATEIINYYVKKGLPVFLHETIKNQKEETKKLDTRKSILKDKLIPLVNQYSNVKLVKTKSVLENELNALTKLRPNIYDISSNTNQKLKTGDVLQVTFKAENTNVQNTVANFYIDTNFNNSYASREVLVSAPLATIANGNGTYTISYQLPKNYAGPRYWKVELVNETTKLKDYELGYFEFAGEKIIINVLQVTNDNNNGSLVSILNGVTGFTKKTTSTGQYKHEDFEINIDVVTKSTFTSKNGSKNYKNLNNGHYNMIIFGFEDDYGINANIFTSGEIQKEITKFIESGQSVFLTHDTLYRDYFSLIVNSNGNSNVYFSHESEWIDTFLKVSGQSYEIKPKTWVGNRTKEEVPHGYVLETNMGFQGPVLSTQATNVNDGLMTNYPFDLTAQSGVIGINTTHAQYFAIDLENPEVIPWYNLYGTTQNNLRDGNAYIGYDSWNHYYTYSIKNITYSGAGHSSSGFTLDEKKLFINTMYRAFLSTNTAPLITPVSPSENGTVYSYQKLIPIEFLVEDLDISDRFIDIKVTINGEVVKLEQVVNGSTQIINYRLKDSDSEIKIVVEAKDESLATTVKEWVIKVEKVDTTFDLEKYFVSNLSTPALNQALSNGFARLDEAVTLNYDVKAKTKLVAKDGSSYNENMSFEVQFYEKIPTGFELLPDSFSTLLNKQITKVADGIEVRGILPTFYYEVKNGELVLQGNPLVQLSAQLIPKVEADYVFNHALIEVVGESQSFGQVSLKTRNGLKTVNLPDEIYLKVEEELKQFIQYGPEQVKTNGVLKPITVSSSDVSILTASPVQNDLLLKGIKEGEAYVTVQSQDIFGTTVTKQIKVIVVEKVNQIIVTPNPIEVEVGQSVDIWIEVLPKHALNKDVKIDLINPTLATWNSALKRVEGKLEGDTILRVTSIENEKVVVDVPVYVYETLKEIKFTKPLYQLNVGDKVNVMDYLIFNPSTVKKKEIESIFSSLGSKVEVVKENGTWYLVAKEAGTSFVTVNGPQQRNGTIPIPATAYFEVIQPKETDNNNLPNNGKW